MIKRELVASRLLPGYVAGCDVRSSGDECAEEMIGPCFAMNKRAVFIWAMLGRDPMERIDCLNDSEARKREMDDPCYWSSSPNRCYCRQYGNV